MKKVLFFLSLIIFISSCEDKEMLLTPINKQLEVSKNNERLVFANQEEFNSVINSLKDKSVEELQEWSKSKEVSTLINAQVSDKYNDFNFPNVLKAIININGEYQIGNSIAWYDNGFKHFAESEKELSYIKQNPSLNENKAVAGAKIITKNVENVLQKATVGGVGGTDVDARHQKQFLFKNNSGSDRKYVHELFCYTESNQVTDTFFGPGFASSSFLYIRIKLEFKTRGNWKAAGENRDIVYNLSGNYTLITDGINVLSNSFSKQGSRYNRSGDLQIPIDGLTQGFSRKLPKWEVEVYGVIEHNVIGDVASNKWINGGIINGVGGVPLW